MEPRNAPPVWFSGCPGIGKSTALFGYLNLPDVAKNGYLWIHFYANKCHVLYKRKENMGEADVASFLFSPEVHKYLMNLVDTVWDVDFIVIDGAPFDSDETSKLFVAAGTRSSNRLKVVACTYVAANRMNTETYAYMNCPKYIDIDSWS